MINGVRDMDIERLQNVRNDPWLMCCCCDKSGLRDFRSSCPMLLERYAVNNPRGQVQYASGAGA